jgi:hypothetical protein
VNKIIILSLIALAFGLSGCVSNEAKQEQLQRAANLKNMTPCQEPRPVVCTMEHNPACGIFRDGTTWEYSSGCMACTRTSVKGYIQASCDSIPMAEDPEANK